ncbi:hypothetical protein DCAR_0728999 [Daucus carota subsp. sativus]|uniref:Uncharacterized protein n=1 Tax=Daucus carota subsp. sativus TaxID=79200 RepID=A0A164TYN0_DAUCS|nr:hypothetical protein DCAR_0728999 [Daucus carota subsp. sativus]
MLVHNSAYTTRMLVVSLMMRLVLEPQKLFQRIDAAKEFIQRHSLCDESSLVAQEDVMNR